MNTPSGQFDTRSLLKTVTVWAVLLAVIVGVWRWRSFEQKSRYANRVLNSRGGTTSTASALYSIRNEGRKGWSWIGYTFFNYIEAVDLSVNASPRKEPREPNEAPLNPVNDETLELLWTFTRLKQLNLRGSEVTDKGLLALIQLEHLERLDVSGTRVTDAGIQAFTAKRPDCQIIIEAEWTLERSPLAEAYWLSKKLGL